MTDIWLQPVHCQDERSLLLHKRLEAFSICDVNGHQLFIPCKEIENGSFANRESSFM